MEDVVKGCKNHQHQDDRQPNAEPDLLRPLGQRTAANRLNSIEQKVTAIEQRDREQVQQPDRDRQHGGQVDQGHKASGRHLARNLRDADRPAELVGRFPAGEDTRRCRTASGRPRTRSLARPSRRRASGPTFSVLMSPGAIERLMPSTPRRCTLPKLSLISLSCGVALSVTCVPPRSTSTVSGSPALMLTMRCMSEKLSIFSPLIERTRSPGLKPATCCGASWLHGIDAGARGLLADSHEDGRENGDRQHEIRDRSGGDDRGARDLTGWKMKLSLFSASVMAAAAALVRHARGVVVAEEFHIAAERDGRDFPARAVAVVEAGNLGTEADREDQHPDAAPARHQKMAELVEEHDDGQDEQERHHIADEAAAKCAQAAHNFHTHYCLVLPCRACRVTQKLA